MRKRFIVVKIQSSHISLSLRATVLRSIQICRSKHTKPILLEARGPLTRTCRSSSLPASPGAPALRSGQTYASSHPNPVPSHAPQAPARHAGRSRRPHTKAAPSRAGALALATRGVPRRDTDHPIRAPHVGARSIVFRLPRWERLPWKVGGSRSPGRRCRPVIR
jgi:hypothetical protein